MNYPSALDFTNHPFITRLEMWLLRAIARSPRIGLIAVKQHGRDCYWVIKDRSDPTTHGATTGDIRRQLEQLYRV